MHLSRKQNIFSQLFSAFLKSTLNFEHFQKKVTPMAYIFLKLPPPKDALSQMSKNSRLRGPVQGWQGKRAETLIQS